jgi:hypothetical protein
VAANSPGANESQRAARDLIDPIIHRLILLAGPMAGQSYAWHWNLTK